MTKEERIQKQMKVYNISREEAEELVAYDEKVDKMTMKELRKDFGEEQWQLIKKLTRSKKEPTAEKAKNSTAKPRKKEASDEKKELFSEIIDALTAKNENFQIKIENKMVIVTKNDKIFKIDLVEQRKPKEK